MKDQKIPKFFPKAKGMFKYGCNKFEHETSKGKYTIGFVSIKEYLATRFITRNQLRVFVRRGWVLLTKGRNTRYSVKELCSESIDEYLGL